MNEPTPQRLLDGLYARGYRVEVGEVVKSEGAPDEIHGCLVDDTRKSAAIDFYICTEPHHLRDPEVINALMNAIEREIDAGQRVVSLRCEVEVG